ncbi:hypothetical protein CYMTET_33327, partial [Cymbomonas tetramitiformis]
VAGVPAKAVSRLCEASRAAKKLRRLLGRCQFDLEELLDMAADETVDDSQVAEMRARAEEVRGRLHTAQGQAHAAMCEISTLQGQFPEVLRHMQHAVPPELLTLWWPDHLMEDFVECVMQPRVSCSRHETGRVKDRDGQYYAVKYLMVTSDDTEVLTMFWRQASRLHRLRHRAIAPILAIFGGRRVFNKICYTIQMPWYEHGQLDQWKAARQPHEAVVRRGMLKVLEAMAHLHHAWVVHCDIRPANILVDGAERPHLVGFTMSLDSATCSKWVPRDSTVPEHDARVTQGYMAPEMARTGPTTASDVYAFGVTLAEVSPPEELRGVDLCALLQELTALDPAQRLSALEACQHPYFFEARTRQDEVMRQCCVVPEQSVCGGGRHHLGEGVECSSGAHFVCKGCLVRHVQERSCRELDGRIPCPAAQAPIGCKSCAYTDTELCRHLPAGDYQHYLSSRQRCMEVMITQDMGAQRVEDLRREVQQLRACRVCLDKEVNRSAMGCGHTCLCSSIARKETAVAATVHDVQDVPVGRVTRGAVCSTVNLRLWL